KGSGPVQPSRAGPLFLAEQSENGRSSQRLRPWSQQAEIANRVTVSVGNVIRESRNEISDGITGEYPLFKFEVVSHELDLVVRDFDEAVLRDGKPPNVATRVPEELCLRGEMSDVNIPPSLVLCG